MLSARPSFISAHPVLAGTALLALYGMVTVGWYHGAAAAVGLVLLLAIRRHRRARRIRNAGLRARADYENMLNTAGDPRGLWGRYPPAGWYPDPYNTQQMRFFDGATWTPQAAWCQPTFGQ